MSSKTRDSASKKFGLKFSIFFSLDHYEPQVFLRFQQDWYFQGP